MFLKNYSSLIDNTYSYLGYKNIPKSKEIDLLIEECLKEVIELSSFKYIYQEFDYILDFLKEKPYLDYLKGATSYYISAMTLGSDIDKRIRYYSISNMTKMCVFDACSSAYLEYLSDEYEKNLNENISYRFCPGYQGTSITDIKEIFKILKPEKALGIELLESNLMVPSKTMVGIIGVNNKFEKNCGNCINNNECAYLKAGRKCYL